MKRRYLKKIGFLIIAVLFFWANTVILNGIISNSITHSNTNDSVNEILPDSSGFDPQLTKSVGGGPESVFIEDANNDGYVDIITANFWDNNVSILIWNNSLNDWENQITRSVGGGPGNVFVGDANNDGYNDIITANYWDGNISILIWNTSLNEWDNQITKPVGGGPECVCLGDLNNEGFNNIVVTNSWDNNLSVLTWNASIGDWDPEISVSVGNAPESIFIGDANNDGFNDTIVTNYWDDTVSILIWNASSTSWDPEVIKSVGNGPGSVYIKDANNDGYNDIVTANYVDDSVSMLIWNASSISWDQEVIKSVGDGPECVFIEDINFDGYNDIITSNYGDSNISILIWNVISYDWNPQITKSVGNGPGSVYIKDANNDGYNDIVVSNFQDNTISILLFKTTPIPDDMFEENDDLPSAYYITNDTFYSDLVFLDLDFYYFNASEDFYIIPLIEYLNVEVDIYLYLYNSTFDLVAENSLSEDLQYLTDYTGYYYIGILSTELNVYYNLTINLIIPPNPPGNFSLSSDAGDPDINGNFTLNWTKSEDALNYSVFQYSSYITEINESLTTLIEGFTNNNLSLYDFMNGTYFFIVASYNEIGYTISNCISIIVAIPAPLNPPGDFFLSTNAGTPDDDGNFTLYWAKSDRANNYSIYRYSNYITAINTSLTLIVEGTINNNLSLYDFMNGTYYFIVVAYNEIGYTLSNCIVISVTIPPPPPPKSEYEILSYNIFIFLIVIISYSLVIIKKYKHKHSLLNSPKPKRP